MWKQDTPRSLGQLGRSSLGKSVVWTVQSFLSLEAPLALDLNDFHDTKIRQCSHMSAACWHKVRTLPLVDPALPAGSQVAAIASRTSPLFQVPCMMGQGLAEATSNHTPWPFLVTPSTWADRLDIVVPAAPSGQRFVARRRIKKRGGNAFFLDHVWTTCILFAEHPWLAGGA